MNKLIRIGTRASKLALWQAEHVAELIRASGYRTEIVPVETKGDKVLDVSIAKIGSKGVFTEELEAMLIDGSIDIAVHSAKDLASALPDELELIAFTQNAKSSMMCSSVIARVSISLPTRSKSARRQHDGWPS